MEQVEALETAILKRAERLAGEYRERAEHSRDNILAEARLRLQRREERETLQAKSRADLAFRRRVQGHELKLRKEMDHLRWNLVQSVRNQLHDRLRELTRDEGRYFPLLQSLMRHAAEAFEQRRLTASVNARDLGRLQPVWQTFVAEATDKQITLSNTAIDSIGGIIISSEDGRSRINNSFEGREERLAERLDEAIQERLFPATVQNNSGGLP